jgi:hypothetical protein
MTDTGCGVQNIVPRVADPEQECLNKKITICPMPDTVPRKMLFAL